MEAIKILYILLLIVFSLIGYSILQIKLAGISIKDFWSFVKAVKELDKLYRFLKTYKKMTAIQQIVFLSQAEKIFLAFDKIPSIIWDDKYLKYCQVLETYKNIRLSKWSEVNV